MIPIEGIDKIKVLLNQNCKIKHIDPYNRLTLQNAGAYKSLTINAEWFIPYLDYQWQIVNAIYFLIKKGVLIFPDKPYTTFYIYNNPYYFFSEIIETEFYSDFKPKNVEVVPEAVENGKLIRYVDNKSGTPTNTVYSPDYNAEQDRHSIVIHYDKCEKNMQDNHISHKELAEYPNTMRMEFRLYKNNNCRYLHWVNFRGNYFEIFNRFSELLAILYNNYVAGNFITHGKENVGWNKVKRIADRKRDKGAKIQQRYRGKKLMRTDAETEQVIEIRQVQIKMPKLIENHT
ncbi:hypothetical protein AGMMS50212_10340 [Spirochaetia bacterium]|nr:hypothetical protein AGMMS50212_10340 [Spirochaetia bacterium]